MVKKGFKKLNPSILLLVLVILVVAFYAAMVAVVFFEVDSSTVQLTILLLGFVPIVGIFGAWMAIFYILKTRRQSVIKSFDIFAESLIPASGIGIIMFDDHGLIYWTSKFIHPKIEKRLVGKNISVLSDDFKAEYLNEKKVFQFSYGTVTFEARVYPDSKIIVLRDVTNENTLLKLYAEEKYVIGELEVDNLQQLQVVLPEDTLFKLQTLVTKTIDELVERYNIAYRQYVNGKYLIIANQEVLNKLIETDFVFLNRLREQKVISDMKLTISLGFGAGLGTQKELLDFAKEGLSLAQARGGDQVVIVENGKKPQYFGAKMDSAKITSRVRIKQIAEHFETRMYDKKIKRVIIYGHVFADLDAIGAALGVYDFARALNKEAYIQNWTYDITTANVLAKFSKLESGMFIRPTRASSLTVEESTMVVIVDTADIDRIENPTALSNVNPQNVFVFDHHRVAKLPKSIPTQNVYIDTAASSASEIIAEVLQFSATLVKPSKLTAQMMLNGIYLDTKQFTKSVSARTYSAAAWLETYGAQSSVSVEVMKLPAQYDNLIRAMVNDAKEIMPGYFLTTYDGEVPQDIVSIVADEILRVQNHHAAFVIAKVPGEKKYKLSARSININVQIIAESVGGGGGFSSAAAESTEPLPIFVDNIIQAIVSSKSSSLAKEKTSLEQLQTSTNALGESWK